MKINKINTINTINIKNNYLFELYIYKIFINKNVEYQKLNTQSSLNFDLKKVTKIIFSYREIDFGNINNKDKKKLSCYKCTTYSNINLENIINKNMDSILEMFEFSNNKLTNKFINKIMINNLYNNLYNNECIMCLELKPQSNNYFQCLHCKSKFLCYECFKRLQNDQRLNNKCLLCFQNYL